MIAHCGFEMLLELYFSLRFVNCSISLGRTGGIKPFGHIKMYALGLDGCCLLENIEMLQGRKYGVCSVDLVNRDTKQLGEVINLSE